MENKNDEYFEIKKIKLDEFEKAAKKEKASLLRSDIVVAVLSIITSSAFAIRGGNPFLAFAQLFTLPIAGLVLVNIKTLSIIKKKRVEIMKDLESTNNDVDSINRGKKG